VDEGVVLANAGFTAAPAEVAQEQKFFSQHRPDQEFETGAPNYLMLKAEKLQ